MSRIFKALKRVSLRGSESSLYPPGAPEIPAELINGRNGSIHAHAPGSASQFEVERPEEEVYVGEPITLAIIGGGQRGKAFAEYARLHSKTCKVVAIAEPRPETRTEFASKYGIPDKHAFATHTELLALNDVFIADGKSRIAAAVVICVQDKLHAELTIDFAKRGFHVLCEKPLGVTVQECQKVADEVEKSSVVFALGHNFPYSSYASSLTELIHSNTLGRLLHIMHLEPVGYYHFAHSYVRGHWQSEKTSAPLVLTKSSHDLDIFCRWLWPLHPRYVSSFAGLGHFRRERKPPEARVRGVMKCLDCPASVESRCEYSAKRIYLVPAQAGMSGWPGNLIVDGRVTVEKMQRALEETPYGLCVYESANDVPDHQTISIQFSAPRDDRSRVGSPERNEQRLIVDLPTMSPTVSFTIAAHTDSICVRKTTMYFEHGEVIGDGSTYTVSDFREIGKGAKRVVPPRPEGGGHGGGDWGLMEAWLKAINEKEKGEEVRALGPGAGVRDQLRVFMTGFAIEEARKELKVVDCQEFERRIVQGGTPEASIARIAIAYESERPS